MSEETLQKLAKAKSAISFKQAEGLIRQAITAIAVLANERKKDFWDGVNRSKID